MFHAGGQQTHAGYFDLSGRAQSAIEPTRFVGSGGGKPDSAGSLRHRAEGRRQSVTGSSAVEELSRS
jgi:hypothetical protein